MGNIGDAGLLLLDLDLLVEFGRHALEIGDHHLDLRHLAVLLVDLEFLEPDQALAARLHDLYSLHLKSQHTICPPSPGSPRAADSRRRCWCALPAAGPETPPAQG